MMIALMALYLALLFILVWLGVIRFNTFWKVSPLIVLLLLNLGLFIPMGWGAPQGAALVYRNAVSIVPDVAGEVTEVPVTANVPLKAGDVLFRIDPTPYDAQVKTISAQLKLSDTRLSQIAIGVPDAGGRFMSLQAFNQDHYVVGNVRYGAGRYVFDKDSVGTRYMLIGIRTLVDPNNPKDVSEVHALQDSIKIDQQSSGKLEVPNWDPVSQKKVRDALLALGMQAEANASCRVRL